jgi:hypothetical protein
MFKCKVCLEKDKRIADLKSQIDFYKTMLRPGENLSAVHLEANKILEGANEPIYDMPVIEIEQSDSKDVRTERRVIEQEFNTIISGNY